MQSTVRVVTNVGESRMIVQRLLSKDQCVIGLDVEGERFTCPDGQISLIQVADEMQNVFLFDVYTTEDIFHQGHLLKLLNSPKVLKIMHDCRPDSGAIYRHYTVILSNVFDTQAASMLLQIRKGSGSWLDPPHVSLKTLCQHYNVPLPVWLKDSVKFAMMTNGSFWLQRPLTDSMKQYAATDAALLIPLWQKMHVEIAQQDNQFFKQLCIEQVYTMIDKEWVREQQEIRKGRELQHRLSIHPSIILSKGQRKLVRKYNSWLETTNSADSNPNRTWNTS